MARHPSCGVMLCKAIGAQHVREARVAAGFCVSVFRPLLSIGDGVCTVRRVERIGGDAFQRLVVRRQRAIFEPTAYPDPAHAIRMHDEWLVASESFVAGCIFWRLIFGGFGLGEIRIIQTGPLFLFFVSPDELLAFAPWFAIGTCRSAVVEDPPIARPGIAPSVSVSALRIPLSRFVLAPCGHDSGVDPAATRSRAVILQFPIAGYKLV